jgi:aspartyl-tRNA(Asn)/glutamyl-tRNA(Gln) amidotransferase subunit C
LFLQFCFCNRDPDLLTKPAPYKVGMLSPNFYSLDILKSMIDQAQVHKVANLARLALTETEEVQFTTQLGSILDYFEQLSELDVSNVEPTTRAIDVSNVTRPDDLQAIGDREAILANAPDQDGDFFKVPKIMKDQED